MIELNPSECVFFTMKSLQESVASSRLIMTRYLDNGLDILIL